MSNLVNLESIPPEYYPQLIQMLMWTICMFVVFVAVLFAFLLIVFLAWHIRKSEAAAFRMELRQLHRDWRASRRKNSGKT